jgi:glucosamine-phosphate N-acetyltransferase
MEYISLQELLNSDSIKEQNIKGQYIHLLSHLTSTYDLTFDTFNNNIKKISNMGLILVCIIREKEDLLLVGTGTIIIEPKIIHGGKSVGHIEDVVVHPFYRGKGIAQSILNMLVEYSKESCYKVILNCNPNMEQFYKRVGFDKKCIQMSLVHPLSN